MDGLAGDGQGDALCGGAGGEVEADRVPGQKIWSTCLAFGAKWAPGGTAAPSSLMSRRDNARPVMPVVIWPRKRRRVSSSGWDIVYEYSTLFLTACYARCSKGWHYRLTIDVEQKGPPEGRAVRGGARDAYFLARSKRSRFMTFVQAVTKSWTSFVLPSALA